MCTVIARLTHCPLGWFASSYIVLVPDYTLRKIRVAKWVRYYCCDRSGSLPTSSCIFIDRVALAKQGDNRIGSVRPSVCPSVCPSVRPSVRLSVRPSVRPSVSQQWATTTITSLKVIVFVSVISGRFADNRADAVDRLLITFLPPFYASLKQSKDRHRWIAWWRPFLLFLERQKISIYELSCSVREC